MQKDITTADGGIKNTNSSTVRSQAQRPLVPLDQRQSSFFGFTSLYSSVSPKTSLPNSVSLTPSAGSCDEDNHSNATEHRLQLARLILEHQELLNRYTLCLSTLQESAKEVEALLQENATLRMLNQNLTQRLSLLTQSTINSNCMSSGYPSLSIVNDFRRLCIGDNMRTNRVSDEVLDTSPTSVINNRFERGNVQRITLPKSISIRSCGYVKSNHADDGHGHQHGGPSGSSSRVRAACPVADATDDSVVRAQQRVYVAGDKKEEEPLELEVYKQGTFKTELCNKWQETGSCPYGDHCQFAHGISELRPVIRHPRYKTEVCRMVLSGDSCPYGHRCHFRHVLTEQEKFRGGFN